MENDRKAYGKPGTKKSNTDHPSSPPSSDLNTKHQQIINQHLPIGIVESSLEGKYLNANEEFCGMLGYEKDELLQRGIKDVTQVEDYHIDNLLRVRSPITKWKNALCVKTVRPSGLN
jgi:PAS domain-containing protein